MSFTFARDFSLDFAYARRSLRRTPGLVVTVLIVLGTAIGVNATLFTVLAGVVWRPWGGVAAPDDVVRLYLRDSTGPAVGLSIADGRALSGAARSFSSVALLRSDSLQVQVAGVPRVARTRFVTGNTFQLLGLTPVYGRAIEMSDDRSDAPQAVVMLSDEFWRRHFTGDPSVIGSTLRVQDRQVAVVGVVPAAFENSEPGFETDLYFPLEALTVLRSGDAGAASSLTDTTACCVDVVARLRPGVDREAAQAEFDVIARRFTGVSGTPARGGVVVDTAFGSQPGRLDAAELLVTAGMLTGALLLVWLIACANIGNLLLARAVGRTPEMATRAALGAGRGRLLRQLLTEAFVLAAAASAVGGALSAWLPTVLFRLVAEPGVRVQFPFPVAPDGMVLGYILIAAWISVVTCAVAPAFAVTRMSLLLSARQRDATFGRLRLRGVLLTVQVAVSVVLLVAAGLLVRGVQRGAANFDPGFAVDDVTVVSFELPEGVYDRERAVALFSAVSRSAAELPGVAHAFASREPFSLYREGTRTRLLSEANEQMRETLYLNVSAEYLPLLNIPLRAGRTFSRTDTGLPLVIVNEAMARIYWPDATPVGQRFVMRRRGPAGELETQEVIGVARDIHTSLNNRTRPMFYRASAPGADVLDFISADPRASQSPVLLLKGSSASAARVRSTVARLDSRITVRLTNLADSLQTVRASAKWGPILAATLGLVALVLASVGMFGVFAYAVHQRTREIGLRMALGAPATAVARVVIASHGRAIGMGVVFGVIAAAGVSNGLRGRLYGVSVLDPLTYGAVALVLVTCALAASYVPVRRATSIAPIAALRTE